jgi:SPP1 gp7 family putative phage head morphogenesis protein
MSNMRFIQEVKKRKERREARGNMEPIETGSPISYPKMIERTYSQKLRRIVRELDKAVKSTVVARLESILRDARRANERFDNYVDDLSAVFDQMRIVYGEQIDDPSITNVVSETGNAVNATNASAFASKISAVTGVNVISNTPGIRDAVNVWTRKNVTLIKTLGDEHFKDIERIVIDGVEEGKALRTITKEIQERTKASRNRAKLIARDQVGKLTANVTARRSSDLGIKRFRWVTSLDDRVRASHRALHGKVYSYEKGADVDGQSGVLPGEPINCRCAIIPIISSVGESDAETRQKVSSGEENRPEDETARLREELATLRRRNQKIEEETEAIKRRTEEKRRQLEEINSQKVKVTPLEKGVAIVEKNGRAFKVSKSGGKWTISSPEGRVLTEAKTRKQAVAIIEGAKI